MSGTTLMITKFIFCAMCNAGSSLPGLLGTHPSKLHLGIIRIRFLVTDDFVLADAAAASDHGNAAATTAYSQKVFLFFFETTATPMSTILLRNVGAITIHPT